MNEAKMGLRDLCELTHNRYDNAKRIVESLNGNPYFGEYIQIGDCVETISGDVIEIKNIMLNKKQSLAVAVILDNTYLQAVVNHWCKIDALISGDMYDKEKVLK